MDPIVEREASLQRSVMVYIITGIVFMLLPGTFLGVWNLISISSRHQLDSLSAAWLQAHGHAQIYGWIGTFILGIGFHSLAKMADLPKFAVSRTWISYFLWTAGVALRWTGNVTNWAWRIALPVSALLEMAGFLLFFATISGHRAVNTSVDTEVPRKPREPWMRVVIGSTFGFLCALLLNLYTACQTALSGATPAIDHVLDQRLLAVPIWGFLIPAVWGFNARWLPVFLGLRAPGGHRLVAACAAAWAGVLVTAGGQSLWSTALMLCAAVLASFALHIFHRPERPAKTIGVHPLFPWFVRVAYGWLIIGASLGVWAAVADRTGGIWGASRHAITVGFLGAMIFSIGPRILPAICGARILFSKQAMLGSVLLLNIGCALRVASEFPAYEGFAHAQLFWRVLPVSAVTELTAVTLFAANLLVTFARPPAHLPQPKILRQPTSSGAGA